MEEDHEPGGDGGEEIGDGEGPDPFLKQEFGRAERLDDGVGGGKQKKVPEEQAGQFFLSRPEVEKAAR